MLSLEQIKRLENRVYKAVELLKAMKEDNSILKSELKSANERVEELEQIISDYRNNQLEIEQGIVKAIQQLDDLDSIDEDSSENSEEPVNFISPETESLLETSPVQETREPLNGAEHPEGISSPETENKPVIPAASDATSEINNTSSIEDRETDNESVPEESSQQLDIF